MQKNWEIIERVKQKVYINKGVKHWITIKDSKNPAYYFEDTSGKSDQSCPLIPVEFTHFNLFRDEEKKQEVDMSFSRKRAIIDNCGVST